MNDKGQVNVGMMIMVAVGIIVCLIMLTASYGNIGKVTNTMTTTNYTIITPAAGSVKDLIGQEIITTPTVTNTTSGGAVPTTNYTIAETVSASDGLKRVSYKTLGPDYAGVNVSISYTYGPEGYADDAGARSVTSVLAILIAIAVMAIALYPILQQKFGW